MKKKKLFKSKLQMVIYMFIFAICIGLFILIGRTDFNKDIDTDGEKFSTLYNLVPKDNLYTFANGTEVLNIINKRNGIILFGFPSNIWTNYYANILNDVCMELNIDKIYYYDFLKDRDESNGTYETIVNKLDGYVTVNDEGIKDINAPAVLIVKNGEILGYFDDTSIMKSGITPSIYYTDYQRGITYEGFKTAITEYLNRS